MAPDSGEEENLTQEEQIAALLQKARDAMLASEEAMAAGDWAAYGIAQNQLNSALEQLIDLYGLDTADANAEGDGDAAAGTEGDKDLGTLGEDAKDATDD